MIWDSMGPTGCFFCVGVFPIIWFISCLHVTTMPAPGILISITGAVLLPKALIWKIQLEVWKVWLEIWAIIHQRILLSRISKVSNQNPTNASWANVLKLFPENIIHPNCLLGCYCRTINNITRKETDNIQKTVWQPHWSSHRDLQF